MRNHHFLVVCYPIQGHVNPSLQLAGRLLRLGVQVTVATTAYGRRLMNKTHPPATTPGFSFATISDGFDEPFKPEDNDVDITRYFSDLRRCGSQSLRHLIVSAVDCGRPITFVIYGILLTWVAEVASEFDIPSALLFVQSAALSTLYYHYFIDYGDSICNKFNDPNSSIELPGLPLLSRRDLPSFFSSSGTQAFLLAPMREDFEFLEKQGHPKILVNTFDALETEALRAIGKLKMISIGPLIPNAFLNGKVTDETSFGGDVFQGYIEWLNSQPNSSVVYVSFGTMYGPSDQQEEEIASALLECGYEFLWVMKSQEKNEGELEKKVKKLEERGKIVGWCSQLEVLTHPSLGCFMTHCGWNSTMESLISGSPVIAFPQQVEQATNAKLIEDVWKTGVRVKANAEGLVEKEEIRRCLEMVMGGGEGVGIKLNAKTWKKLAMEAVGEGGSSDLNLKTFVTEIDERSS